MAIVLLVLLRLVLGFGLGGEWGGAMLLTLETFKTRRGFYSSFIQSTVGISLILGTLIFIPLVYLLPSSFMYSIGWRIPFLASFVILVVVIFIRMKVRETPVFLDEEKDKKILQLPAKELFKVHWKKVLAGIMLAGSFGNFFYFAFSLLPVLFESTKAITIFQGLIGSAIFGIVNIIFVFIGGGLSDKVGRRTVIAGANILALIVLFPSIYLVGFVYFILFISIFSAANGFGATAMSAMISEMFPTNVRYSGNSTCYQYGNSFIGGPAPYVSDFLGSINYVLYPVFTLLFILIALGVIFKSGETNNLNLEDDSSYST